MSVCYNIKTIWKHIIIYKYTSRPFIQIKNRNHYYFEGEIPHLPGLARFILGLPGEIKVEEGNELKAYLAEQIQKGFY